VNGRAPKYRREIEGKYAVYRVFDFKGDLLYVGATSNFEGRMISHGGTKKWWKSADHSLTQVGWFNTAEEASAHEAAAIMADLPRYNKSGKPGQPGTKYSPTPLRPALPMVPEAMPMNMDSMTLGAASDELRMINAARIELMALRDRQIGIAVAAGHTWAEMQKVTGLSPRGLALALKRDRER